MRDTIYLIVDRKGVVAHRKGQPNLRSGEFAVKLSVEISDRFFTQSIPEAYLQVPDDYVIQPKIALQLLEQLKEVEGE